jgi:hypothetical protein
MFPEASVGPLVILAFAALGLVILGKVNADETCRHINAHFTEQVLAGAECTSPISVRATRPAGLSCNRVTFADSY